MRQRMVDYAVCAKGGEEDNRDCDNGYQRAIKQHIENGHGKELVQGIVC